MTATPTTTTASTYIVPMSLSPVILLWYSCDTTPTTTTASTYITSVMISCDTAASKTFITTTATSTTASTYILPDHLVGLVVKASTSRAEGPGSNPACAGIFSGSSHTSDLKIGTPVATLPGAWRYRVSILWLGEVERWICNFYLSVAARKIVWADPSLRYTSLLLGR